MTGSSGECRPTATAASPAAVALRLVEQVWNAGELDLLGELFADPFEHGGRQDTVEALRAWHRADATAFGDSRYEVRDLVAQGDTVALRWRATARHTGTWGPVEATGRDVAWEGAHFLTVEDGRITRLWALGDTFGKARQLGAIS